MIRWGLQDNYYRIEMQCLKSRSWIWQEQHLKNRESPTIARAMKHPAHHLQYLLWLRRCSITPSFQTATSASAADPASTPALNSACNDVPAKVTVNREESVNSQMTLSVLFVGNPISSYPKTEAVGRTWPPLLPPPLWQRYKKDRI